MEQGIFWRNQGILPREQRNSLRKQAIEECGLVGRRVCVHVDGRAARRLPARCRSCSAWNGAARGSRMGHSTCLPADSSTHLRVTAIAIRRVSIGLL